MTSIPGAARVARLARRAAGALRRRSPRGVVLLYHRVAGPRRDPQWLDVSPANFDAQLGVLAGGAVPLSLEAFEECRRRGTLPHRAVTVTFDDGYADNLLVAAPLLARHGVPATLFVTAGMVGAVREFWWDDVERIVFSPARLGGTLPRLELPWSEADGMAPVSEDRWTVLDASDPTPRHRLYRALCQEVRSLPTDVCEARLDEWRAWAGVPAPARATHRTLTLDELRTMAAQPGISIGAHTMTHPVLSLLSPLAQRRELADSRTWLEDAIRAPVRSAAYPFGTRADVSKETEWAAAGAGFEFAMANEPGTAWRWSSRWLVPRVLVRDWGAAEFARRLDQWLAD